MKNSTVAIMIASVVVAAVAIAVVVLISNQPSPHPLTQDSNIPIANQTSTQQNMAGTTEIQGLKKFNSTDELQKFLLDSQAKASVQYFGGPAYGGVALERLGAAQSQTTAPVPSVTLGDQASGQQKGAAASTNAGVQYSTTNIQVAGIDEPD